MKLPTLYKSKKGRLQEWNVFVHDRKTHAEIVVEWGQVDGKKQTKSTIVKQGKNIGKANETSYLEQATFEAHSKYNKEWDKGYRSSPAEAEAQEKVKIRPMLAEKYPEHKHKLNFPVYIQPKLDGMRALTYLEGDDVVMLSRGGKEITTGDHIKEELRSLLEENPHLVFDGELYQHGKSLQKILSNVKRDEANAGSQNIEYWIYDCFSKICPTLSYKDRFGIVTSHIAVGRYKNVVMVDTTPCKTEEDIFKEHSLYVQNGFEGSIIRGAESVYKIDGRSDQLLKLKDFNDSEFEIVGVGEDKNGHPVFVCKMDDGKLFDAKPKGTHEERVDMLKKAKQSFGKLMTVKYFGFTDDGIPRFPVGLAIRDYE